MTNLKNCLPYHCTNYGKLAADKTGKKIIIMRFLKLIFFSFFFLVSVSCATSVNRTDVICVAYDTGDRQGYLFIGTDNQSIDSSYRNDSIIQRDIEFSARIERFILKRETVDYLAEYTNNNCNTIDEDARKKLAIFTIVSYSRSDVHKCYYYDKDEIVEYFNGMITWLNKSPHREECREFIAQLQLIVKVHK